MIKMILIFLTVFSGCSTKQYIFVDVPYTQTLKTFRSSIAIKEIELPFYLKDAKVAYIEDLKIKYFNSYFCDDAKEFTTNRAKQILENSLKYSKIYLYPWEGKGKNLLSIDIKKFISDKRYIYLVASYKYYHDKKLTISKNYHDKEVIKTFDEKTVIKQMQEMYDRFIKQIAREI